MGTVTTALRTSSPGMGRVFTDPTFWGKRKTGQVDEWDEIEMEKGKTNQRTNGWTESRQLEMGGSDSFLGRAYANLCACRNVTKLFRE